MVFHYPTRLPGCCLQLGRLTEALPFFHDVLIARYCQQLDTFAGIEFSAEPGWAKGGKGDRLGLKPAAEKPGAKGGGPAAAASSNKGELCAVSTYST